MTYQGIRKCNKCGKEIDQSGADYSYHKWHKIFCMEHSPITTHQDPYKPNNIEEQKTFIKEQGIDSIPF